MVGNTRDGVEGVFDHGLSILDHEPSQGSQSNNTQDEPMSADGLLPSTNEKIHSEHANITPSLCCVIRLFIRQHGFGGGGVGGVLRSQQLLFSSSFLLFLAFIWTVCKRTDICHLFLSIIWDADYSHVYTLFLFIHNCFWFCFVVFEGRLLESIVW